MKEAGSGTTTARSFFILALAFSLIFVAILKNLLLPARTASYQYQLLHYIAKSVFVESFSIKI